MKKQLLLAGVAVAALMSGTPGRAADLPLKAPPAPPFTWTGCYIGGHIGFGVGNKEFIDSLGGSDLSGTTGDGAGPSLAGFLGGGQIGCNYQFANNWVIGIEGAGSGADLSGSTISPFNGKTLSARTDWLASVTGRVGYTVNQWLFYVKGGAAWAGDHFQVMETGGAPNTYNLSQTRFGATVGVGAEYAFWTHWSARVEYNFYAFGSDSNLFFGCTNPVNQTLFCGTPATRGPETIKQDINQFTVGLNYRFY